MPSPAAAIIPAAIRATLTGQKSSPFPTAWASLEPYLPEGIRQPYYGGLRLPGSAGGFKKDSVPPQGGVPASDPEFVVNDLLDRYGIHYAILIPGNTLPLPGLPDFDAAAA